MNTQAIISPPTLRLGERSRVVQLCDAQILRTDRKNLSVMIIGFLQPTVKWDVQTETVWIAVSPAREQSIDQSPRDKRVSKSDIRRTTISWTQ